MAVTWFVASAQPVRAIDLVANGWMQNPIASVSIENHRMEMVSFSRTVLMPVAQVKFVHTVASGYTCGAMFVLGISSSSALKGRHRLCQTLLRHRCQLWYGCHSVVIVLGDGSRYEMGDVQKTKLAAISRMGHSAGAGLLHPVRHSRSRTRSNSFFQIPYALGLIATRSGPQVTGLKDLMAQHGCVSATG